MKPQIKASLFLGLFSLMLLHQMIPHLHHGHGGDHDHEVTGQVHSHKHQHEKKSEDPKDFFSILMAMHSHGGSSSEVPVVENSIQSVFLKRVKSEISILQVYFPLKNFSEDEAAALIRSYHPPPKYFDPYLSFLSLRGPPLLV